jgi:ABC-type sugar transport system substrate-binding protein
MWNKSSRRLLAGMVVAVCLMVTACGSGDTGGGGTGAKETPKVGFMAFDIGVDPFVSVMVESIQTAAKEKGLQLDVRNGQGDLNQQISIVRQFITEKKDAIIVYPGDPEGIAPVIRQADQQKIPVFTVNLQLKEGTPVTAYVGADDREYGRKQGELVVKAIGEKGNVGLLMGQLGTSAQLQRTEGIKEYFKDYPGIKIVEQQNDDWAAEKALAATQNWVSKYPKGQLNAIVAQGPQAVGAARWARQQRGRSEIEFILGDYPADVKQAISDGLIFGTVNQDPKPQGQTVVESVQLWLDGQQDKVVRPNHFLPLPLVTKENVADSPAAYGT